MKVHVTAKTNAEASKLEVKDSSHLKISVTEPAKEGKANKAIIKALAVYFHIPKSRITLISGKHYKEKVFEV